MNRRFQEGQFCGSETEIVITLSQKQYRRDGLGRLKNVNYPLVDSFTPPEQLLQGAKTTSRVRSNGASHKRSSL